VLKGGYERAFTRRKRDEEITDGRASNDAQRAGYSERDAREANESFDAASQLFRVYFNAGAADLLNLVARCAQAAAAFQDGFLRRIGRRGQSLTWKRTADGNFAIGIIRWSKADTLGNDIIHYLLLPDSPRGRTRDPTQRRSYSAAQMRVQELSSVGV
jgi:hypothetical protein